MGKIRLNGSTEEYGKCKFGVGEVDIVNGLVQWKVKVPTGNMRRRKGGWVDNS